MKMRAFIRANRAEIDRMIDEEMFRHDGNGGRGTVPNPPPRRDDAERENWIWNYDPLYQWAMISGVPPLR